MTLPSWTDKKLKRVVPAAGLDLSDNLFRYLTKKGQCRTVEDLLRFDPQTILTADPLAIPLYEECLREVNALREKAGQETISPLVTDPHADSAFRVFGFGVSRKLYGFFSKDFGLPFLDLIKKMKPDHLSAYPEYAECEDEFRYLLSRLKAPGFTWDGHPWEMRGKTGGSSTQKKKVTWGYYDENNPRPKRGRKSKFQSEEERLAHRQEYNRQYNKQYGKKRQAARAAQAARDQAVLKRQLVKTIANPEALQAVQKIGPKKSAATKLLELEALPEANRNDFIETGWPLSKRARRFLFYFQKVGSLEEIAALDPRQFKKYPYVGDTTAAELTGLVEHVRERLDQGPPPTAAILLADLWPEPEWHQPFADEFIFTAETASRLSPATWERLLPVHRPDLLWPRLTQIFKASEQPPTPLSPQAAWSALASPLSDFLQRLTKQEVALWPQTRLRWADSSLPPARLNSIPYKTLTRVTLALLSDPSLNNLMSSMAGSLAALDYPLSTTWFEDHPVLSPPERRVGQQFLHVLWPLAIEPALGLAPTQVTL